RTYSAPSLTPVPPPPLTATLSLHDALPISLIVAAPGVLGNDSDSDSATITALLVAGPAHGTLTLNANGSFTYTPTANYNGPDSLDRKSTRLTSSHNITTYALFCSNNNDPPV